MKSERMDQGTFGLEDRAFWSDPWQRRDEVERTFDRGAEQCAFDAPREVKLDEGRSTIPAIVLRGAPNSPRYYTDFGQNAVLVATSARERKSYVSTVDPPATDEIRPPRPAAPASDEGAGWYSEGYRIDLREQLDLPWGKPDTYWVTLLLRDRTLGRATVRVTEHVEYHDEEAARYLEATRQKPAPLPVWPRPGKTLPSYERRERSPSIPSSPGITLAAERVVPSRSPERCVLWGSYRLPVEPRDRLNAEVAFTTVSRLATAVVPFSLVLVGSKYAAPKVWHLAVPCFEPLEEAEGTLLARGYFALNLQAMVNLCAIEQTYFFHAFAGEIASAPATTAIVDAG